MALVGNLGGLVEVHPSCEASLCEVRGWSGDAWRRPPLPACCTQPRPPLPVPPRFRHAWAPLPLLARLDPRIPGRQQRCSRRWNSEGSCRSSRPGQPAAALKPSQPALPGTRLPPAHWLTSLLAERQPYWPPPPLPPLRRPALHERSRPPRARRCWACCWWRCWRARACPAPTPAASVWSQPLATCCPSTSLGLNMSTASAAGVRAGGALAGGSGGDQVGCPGSDGLPALGAGHAHLLCLARPPPQPTLLAPVPQAAPQAAPRSWRAAQCGQAVLRGWPASAAAGCRQWHSVSGNSCTPPGVALRPAVCQHPDRFPSAAPALAHTPKRCVCVWWWWWWWWWRWWWVGGWVGGGGPPSSARRHGAGEGRCQRSLRSVRAALRGAWMPAAPV